MLIATGYVIHQNFATLLESITLLVKHLKPSLSNREAFQVKGSTPYGTVFL